MPDVKQLLEAGVHFGHKTSKWCPKMKSYVWGSRNKIYFIDVAKTAFILEQACKQIKEITKKGGKLLWVGTKMSAREAIEKSGQDLDMPRVVHRWIGGTLTNFDQVKKGVSRLLHLRDVINKPLVHLKKKEIVKIKKEAARLDKNFGGITNLKYPPAALVVVDVKKEATAIKEAFACNIPVIGLVDTNSDPSMLTIAIPTNDDSSKAVSLIVSTLAQAAKEGSAEHKEHVQKARAQAKTETEKKLDKPKKAAAEKAVKAEEKPAKKVEAKAAEKKPAAKAEAAPAKEDKKEVKKAEAPAKKAAEKKPASKAAPKAAAKKETATKPAAKKPIAKKPMAKKATTKK